MPSIAEQIHAYHALKAQKGRAQAAALPSKSSKPSDYFRLLMKRWQNDYVRRILQGNQ